MFRLSMFAGSQVMGEVVFVCPGDAVVVPMVIRSKSSIDGARLGSSSSSDVLTTSSSLTRCVVMNGSCSSSVADGRLLASRKHRLKNAFSRSDALLGTLGTSPDPTRYCATT
eukprot:gene7852-biopygen7808